MLGKHSQLTQQTLLTLLEMSIAHTPNETTMFLYNTATPLTINMVETLLRGRKLTVKLAEAKMIHKSDYSSVDGS